MDGEQEQKAGTQRDRMREMIERRGGKLPDLTPEQQMDAPAQATIDLEAIAREEQQEMQGYHGLNVDEASGMKMFYTGNTLSERKRKEKQRQFRIVHFYVELARRAQSVGADVETRTRKVLFTFGFIPFACCGGTFDFFPCFLISDL